MKSMLLVATLVVALATAAGAEPGGNISWDQCWPEGGSATKFFACNTNTGSAELVGSFQLAADMADFIGISIILDGGTADGNPLPDWWQLFNASACRQTALTCSFDFSASPRTACTDPWQGLAQGGIAAYQTELFPPPMPINVPAPDVLRIKLAGALLSPVALSAGVEYYGYRMQIQYTKSVGDGACAGCARGLCLELTQLRASSNSGPGAGLDQVFYYGYPDYPFTPENSSQPRNPGIVSWECASGHWTFNSAYPAYTVFSCDSIANCSVPVRNRTWGSIKALYR